MIRFRRPALFALGLAAAAMATQAAAQSAPERAIRRDIPITRAIQRALEAGTRDSTGRPGPNYWQTRVDYRIEARLDAATSRVTGRQSVTVHNASPDPMPFVLLRLDQNIFRPDAARLITPPEVTEGMRIARLSAGGRDLDLDPPPPPRGQEPAPGAYGLDRTIARVQLHEPIPPGGSGTLEIDWDFRVTRVPDGRGLRHGAWGDSLVQAAQWYPRVAAYDDLRGWDAEPYLGPSEFHNNFGSFDVVLDVPAGWLVGATGTLRNPDEVLSAEAERRLATLLDADSLVTVAGPGHRGPGTGDRARWHFTADSVNDFAWAASSVYVWKAMRVDVPGRGPIPVHILHSRGRTDRYERVPEVTRHALEFYSRLWFPYAFPQLTVVDGPEQGMEYPMFIMTGLGAADHEVGHEWWPMMVGVNETWYGFMDEGFNRYMNILSRADMQGTAPVLDGLGQRYGSISGEEYEAPLMWNANYGGPMYRFQAYDKAPLMLSMLGGIVGDTAVWRAMREYAEAWAFKHPTPWDFAFAMNRALGRDLGWFWYYWLFTTEAVDGSIRAVRTEGGRTTVTVHQAGSMPSPVVLRVDFAAEGPPIRTGPNTRMLNATSAVVTFPVDVWFDGRRTFDAVLDFGGRAIEKITLDPFGRFPDGTPADNVWERT